MSDSPAKKWLRRVVIAALVLANSVVAFVLWQVNQVETIIEEDVVTVDAVEPHLNQPPSDPEEPITFLVLGSDSRDNLPDDWLGDFGVFGGQRADVIMLLKAVPATGELLLMSIPRDLRVDIDGYGTQKINSAYAFGGAPLMVQTVREQFQVPIHHYVEIDFVGFAGLVDELGGLPLEFASPARDLKSGLSVDAGRQILDGRAALAYARSRSYQEFRGGSWVSVDANDIGRTGRQQQLVLAIISEVKRPTNMIGVQSLVRELVRYLSVDPKFVDLDFLGLALAFRSLGSDNIVAMTLPTVSERIDGIWYEIPVQPDADAMVASFSVGGIEALPVDDRPVSPALVVLRVENGNGRSGAAGMWAQALAEAGFDVLSVGDHDSFDVAETTIVLRSPSTAAEGLVAALGFGRIVTGAVPDGVDALVVLGADAPEI